MSNRFSPYSSAQLALIAKSFVETGFSLPDGAAITWTEWSTNRGLDSCEIRYEGHDFEGHVKVTGARARAIYASNRAYMAAFEKFESEYAASHGIPTVSA